MGTDDDYNGNEQRHNTRRRSDMAQSVDVVHVNEGFAKLLKWALGVGTAILIATIIGFLGTWWKAGRWVERIEQTITVSNDNIEHNAEDIRQLRNETADQDAQLAQTISDIANSLRETSETSREVVAEQKALRRDVQDLRTDVRDIRNDQ